jgi:hypothetical protein
MIGGLYDVAFSKSTNRSILEKGRIVVELIGRKGWSYKKYINKAGSLVCQKSKRSVFLIL